jgi:hypothetical protein
MEKTPTTAAQSAAQREESTQIRSYLSSVPKTHTIGCGHFTLLRMPLKSKTKPKRNSSREKHGTTIKTPLLSIMN